MFKGGEAWSVDINWQWRFVSPCSSRREGEVDVVFELQLCVLNFYTGLIYSLLVSLPIYLPFFPFHFNFSRVTLKLTLHEAFQNYIDIFIPSRRGKIFRFNFSRENKIRKFVRKLFLLDTFLHISLPHRHSRMMMSPHRRSIRIVEMKISPPPKIVSSRFLDKTILIPGERSAVSFGFR